MNGGVASAMECLSSEELGAAVRGLEYFGRQDVGHVLRQALHLTCPEGGIRDPEARERHIDMLDDQIHQRLEELDDAYNALLPEDGVLESAFRERLRVSREDFAALS